MTIIKKSQISKSSQPDFDLGEVILIDKESGFSSFYPVKVIKAITKAKKVGHAGTLDPLATGLLILCTGKKTKEISSFQDLIKTYTGIIRLGIRTDTMDSEGKIISENSFDEIIEEDIFKTRDKFLGEISQIPPMFSARKHKGKALYKYARKGEVIRRDAKKINVYSFEITKIDLPDIFFKIECSKGTYIRTIADDFGEEIGTGAYLKLLRRTAIGDYSVNEAFKLSEFEDWFKTDVRIN